MQPSLKYSFLYLCTIALIGAPSVSSQAQSTDSPISVFAQLISDLDPTPEIKNSINGCASKVSGHVVVASNDDKISELVGARWYNGAERADQFGECLTQNWTIGLRSLGIIMPSKPLMYFRAHGGYHYEGSLTTNDIVNRVIQHAALMTEEQFHVCQGLTKILAASRGDGLQKMRATSSLYHISCTHVFHENDFCSWKKPTLKKFTQDSARLQTEMTFSTSVESFTDLSERIHSPSSCL